MAKKNKTVNVDIETDINYNGNWNRKDGEPVWGKAIGIVKFTDQFNDDNFVFGHDELLDMIDIHLQADIENIIAINDPNVNTGNITKPEKSFKDKLLNKIFEKEKEYEGLDEWM